MLNNFSCYCAEDFIVDLFRLDTYITEPIIMQFVPIYIPPSGLWNAFSSVSTSLW